MHRLLGEYKPANWWELQARIAHYGSDDVVSRFEASHNADDKIAMSMIKLGGLNQQFDDAKATGNLSLAPDIRVIQAARKAVQDARYSADEIDQGLIRQMRAELNWTSPAPGEGAEKKV